MDATIKGLNMQIIACQARNVELETALRAIAHMKPEEIGDTGFMTGPAAHFQACQRIARQALGKK